MFWLRMVVVAGAAVPATISSLLRIAPKYRFELDCNPKRTGDTAIIRLRLLSASNRMPVANGAILKSQLVQMQLLRPGAGRMVAVAIRTKVWAAAEPGLFEIEAAPVSAGKAVLTLLGTIGDAETVRGRFALSIPG